MIHYNFLQTININSKITARYYLFLTTQNFILNMGKWRKNKCPFFAKENSQLDNELGHTLILYLQTNVRLRRASYAHGQTRPGQARRAKSQFFTIIMELFRRLNIPWPAGKMDRQIDLWVSEWVSACTNHHYLYRYRSSSSSSSRSSNSSSSSR